MSWLTPEDGPMHYSDTSHRWIAPSEKHQQAWEAKVRAHLQLHRENLTAGVNPRGVSWPKWLDF